MSIKLIDSAESRSPIQEMQLSQLMAETPQGNLYRKRLSPYKAATVFPQLHENVEQILTAVDPPAKEKRRILMRKLIRNAPNNFPIIGKPSSCFAFRDKVGNIFLDYLLESVDKEREGITLHTFLREHPSLAPAYQLKNLFANSTESLMSGHIADITPEYRTNGPAQIFLIDKFSANSKLTSLEKVMLKIIIGNGIVPIGGEGVLVEPFKLAE
ncbi:MAG: hypothetical protein GX559_02090 [Candidatus Pacebacteria bacterium]|nr:hypothetical protein [Candidatus Paceibacterota bacterium]